MLPQSFTASNLSCDGELVKMLISHRAVLLVLVVEHNGHAGLGDSSLALLVDKLL